jgi:DNA polymerase-3 subunit delta'
LFLANPYLSVDDWIETNDAENKQWNITAEECLHIIMNLNLQAFEGKWKVHVIWMGEYLGHEGNRLLKLIEEPPENTIIVIIAEEEDRMLNTILSRCQVFKVPALDDAEISAFLENKDLTYTEIAAITQMATGDLREALQLIDRQISELDKLFLSWLRKTYQGNGIEIVNWIDEFAGLNREEQKKFIHYGLNFLHELLLLKIVGDTRRMREEEKETAIKLNKVLEVDQINEICNLLNKCSIAIERYANTRILMLDGSIQLKNIFKHKKTGTVPA